MKIITNINDSDIEAALKQLQYHPKWLEYGLLTQQQLLTQYQQYLNGEDKNSEHYRYQTFRQILTSHHQLSDQLLTQFIELAQLDPDQTMAVSTLIDLIRFNLLTDEQLTAVSTQPAFVGEVLQKRLAFEFLKRRLLNRISTNGVIEMELFQEILSTNESSLQIKLLSAKQLDDEQLKILAQQGANKDVRTLALQKLKKRSR